MDVCEETVDLVGEDRHDGEKVICEMKQEVNKTEQNIDYNTGQSMEEGNEDTSNQQPLNPITEGVMNSNAKDAVGSNIFYAELSDLKYGKVRGQLFCILLLLLPLLYYYHYYYYHHYHIAGNFRWENIFVVFVVRIKPRMFYPRSFNFIV